tara:strand:- start:1169 stop:2482 length:1314 start_codon:yes stop_codon:yes gene_type:complete
MNKKKTFNGQKMWAIAKKKILGGNMLLSKRPEMHLPGKWPPYFEKAKGSFIWDLENKKYLDLSFMGVGTNILGYSNSSIDKFVINKLKKGNISTLNSYEEVELTKKLLSIHPWFHFAKYTRTGGEANAVAIRIARSISKNQNIAICGYHGWHDWYLAANLSKKKLSNHLLPGLSSVGISKKLKNTIYTFEYNELEKIKNLIEKNKIGIIMMEVSRNKKPKNNFLAKIKSLTKKNQIVLIFDECTSGFREVYGGLHKKYKVYPDIAVFGKALGNGYPINAILGKKKFLKKSSESFISSTFWTERLGTSAALKTLELMREKKSWLYIKKLGQYIKKEWKKLSSKYELNLKIEGLDSICSFVFPENHLLYKSYVTQEMLKKNILASNVVYVSISHNRKMFKKYFTNLDKIFHRISKHKNSKKKFKLLEGEICHSTFKRLN